MKKIILLIIVLLAANSQPASAANPTPLKLGIVGLEHGHIEFLARRRASPRRRTAEPPRR